MPDSGNFSCVETDQYSKTSPPCGATTENPQILRLSGNSLSSVCQQKGHPQRPHLTLLCKAMNDHRLIEFSSRYVHAPSDRSWVKRAPADRTVRQIMPLSMKLSEISNCFVGLDQTDKPVPSWKCSTGNCMNREQSDFSDGSHLRNFSQDSNLSVVLPL